MSSTMAHLIHFIDHSPSLLYLLYLVIVIQTYLHNILTNTILLKHIPSWANIETYASKYNFTNIKWFVFFKMLTFHSLQRSIIIKHFYSIIIYHQNNRIYPLIIIIKNTKLSMMMLKICQNFQQHVQCFPKSPKNLSKEQLSPWSYYLCRNCKIG